MRVILTTRPRRGPWPVVAIIAVLAGCAEPGSALPKATTYEVKGQVLLRDGKPLSKGKVVFVAQDPPALSANGDISPDGTFSLSTLGNDDGAGPGSYKVRTEPAPKDVEGPKGVKNLKFPSKYTDEDASGLLVTVKPEPNRLEPFRLK